MVRLDEAQTGLWEERKGKEMRYHYPILLLTCFHQYAIKRERWHTGGNKLRRGVAIPHLWRSPQFPETGLRKDRWSDMERFLAERYTYWGVCIK